MNFPHDNPLSEKWTLSRNHRSFRSLWERSRLHSDRIRATAGSPRICSSITTSVRRIISNRDRSFSLSCSLSESIRWWCADCRRGCQPSDVFETTRRQDRPAREYLRCDPALSDVCSLSARNQVKCIRTTVDLHSAVFGIFLPAPSPFGEGEVNVNYRNGTRRFSSETEITGFDNWLPPSWRITFQPPQRRVVPKLRSSRLLATSVPFCGIRGCSRYRARGKQIARPTFAKQFSACPLPRASSASELLKNKTRWNVIVYSRNVIKIAQSSLFLFSQLSL